MNGEVFKDWFITKLLPNVPNGSVIVIDRASYHLELRSFSKCASSSWNKAQLTEWILEHKCKNAAGVEYTRADLEAGTVRKIHLIAITQRNKPKKMYLVYDWLAEYNAAHPDRDIKLNVLPVAHPTLNPIEMMWNWLKTWVKSNNHDYTMEAIKSLVEERMQVLNASWWAKAYEHSLQAAVNFVEFDDIQAEVGSGDDDEEEEDEEEDEEDY